MKNVVLWSLIIINSLLFLSFADKYVHESTAKAQFGGGIRRPGDYLMISGLVNGGNAGLVYIVDTVNGQLTAMTYGASGPSSQIESMPPIDLASVFAERQPPARPGR